MLYCYFIHLRIILISFVACFGLNLIAQSDIENLVVKQERRITELSPEELAICNLDLIEMDSTNIESLAKGNITRKKIFILLSNSLIFDVNSLYYENFFHLYYFRFPCLGKVKERAIAYNSIMFDHLKSKYQLRWISEMDKSAIGLRDWKRKNGIGE